jgi:DNA repair exonuclease SbcCD ATPase subunit
VASAENFKDKYDTASRQLRTARQNEDAATDQFNDLKKRTDEEKLKLSGDISALQQQVAALKADVTKLEIEKDMVLRKEGNLVSVMKELTAANDNQRQLLENALDAQKNLNAELIKERKQLDDATAALLEKSAIIAQLQGKLKGMIEDNAMLQNTLDKYLRQYGKAFVQPAPVTQVREAVRVTPPVTDIDLKGSLTAVDLKNHLAELSIGAAEGVKEGMRFHATRDSAFVCDVVILEVEPDKSVGWLELLQEQPQNQPRAGDVVSTSL